jgi:alginate biosynthesis protein Alg44
MTDVHAETRRPNPAHVRMPAAAMPQPIDFAAAAEHPVIRMPFSVVINGRSYVGNGLSIVGAEALGLADPHLDGRVQLVTLVFNFPGYAISLPVEAAVGAGAPETGTVFLRFVEPTGPHLAQLRYLLNAYVAGELIGVDGVIRAAERPVPGARPAEPPRVRASLLGGMAKGLRWGLLAGLGLLLVGFVGVKLYERFFVAPVLGVSTLTLQGMNLRAISSGQIDFVNPQAKQGEIAFAIRATSGEVLAVSMPCDCVVAPGYAASGATVLAGDQVMTVASTDAPVVVSARVDGGGLRMLAAGATAEIELPDGSVTNATLDRAELPALMRGYVEGAPIPVTLLTQDALPNEAVGTPVNVRIKSDPMAALGRFLGSANLPFGQTYGSVK